MNNKEIKVTIDNNNIIVTLYKCYRVKMYDNKSVSKKSTVGGDSFIARAINFGLKKGTITFQTSPLQPYFTIKVKDIESISEYNDTK